MIPYAPIIHQISRKAVVYAFRLKLRARRNPSKVSVQTKNLKGDRLARNFNRKA